MKVKRAAIAALALLLAGCISARHLTSREGAPVITVKNPITIKGLFAHETRLPAGDYRATIEDEKGIYYEAPGKIISSGTALWMQEGGLYMPKASTVPTHYYVITKSGTSQKRKLPRVDAEIFARQ